MAASMSLKCPRPPNSGANTDAESSVPTLLEALFRAWGLHPSLGRYHGRNLGIEHLYSWQARCLAEPGVVEGARDLLYFAPTSGGKTMVAELVLLLRVAGPRPRSAAVSPERESREGKPRTIRRAVVVLPFISMVTEKVKHLQRVVAPYNRGRPKQNRIKVKALYGSRGGGGLGGTQIAVCTIEKANALVNRMAAADELHELSCLVLDELHMIGDGARGQTLELLLTKVLRANRVAGTSSTREEEVRLAQKLVPGMKHIHIPGTLPAVPNGAPRLDSEVSVDSDIGSSQGSQSSSASCYQEPGTAPWRVQIIGMSATLSNSDELARWLGAAVHVSDFRPVPLDERVLMGMEVYDRMKNVVRTFARPAHPETDPDHVVTLCRESCRANDQVIIFCSTKAFCHNCAVKIARNLKSPVSKSVVVKRSALTAQLAKEMSMGVDPILQETIPHGVAFHHAGLADTERSAIENAFRESTLSVLAATSTLGAGVNLPAGRIILRNLTAAGGGLSATSYRQMAGRAGRKGAGRARGESVVIASNKGQMERARALMNAGLAAVKSALAPAADGGAGLTRLVLEAVCGKLVETEAELADYMACTLLWWQQPDDSARQSLLDCVWAALGLLRDEECVHIEAPPGPPQSLRLSTPRQSGHRGTAGLSTSTSTSTPAPFANPYSIAASNKKTAACPDYPTAAVPTAIGSSTVVKSMPNPYHRDINSTKTGKGKTNLASTVAWKVAVAPAFSSAVAAARVATQTSSLATSGLASARGSADCLNPQTWRNAALRGATQTAAVGSTDSAGASDALAAAPAVLAGAVTFQDVGDGDGTMVGRGRLTPTKLGSAIFRSSMAPADGLTVFRDLSEGAKGVNLRNTLHLAYLLTPLCPPSGLRPNWEWLRSIYSKAAASVAQSPPGAGADLLSVFHRIGLTEGLLHAWVNRGPRGGTSLPLLSSAAVARASVARKSGGYSEMTGKNDALVGYWREDQAPSHFSAVRNATRLVAAMALTDVSSGANLGQVAKAYGMNKGDLQSLRQSAATFSSMVASFLKELGWALFSMVVKGHIPKLSLGVSSHLLPLMQVPGMSRVEASALFQGGIVNAKTLLSASLRKVATDLRINVPFRTRKSGGKECAHFGRRAQLLRESAREIIAKREKGSKAQTAKLLKVVQGRLGKGAGAESLANALVGGGGGQDFIRTARKRRKRASLSRRRDAAAGDGGNYVGNAGSSDGSDSYGRDSDTDSSSGDSDTDEDELDRVMAAHVSGRVPEEDSDDDSDNDAIEPVELTSSPGMNEERVSATGGTSGGDTGDTTVEVVAPSELTGLVAAQQSDASLGADSIEVGVASIDAALSGNAEGDVRLVATDKRKTYSRPPVTTAMGRIAHVLAGREAKQNAAVRRDVETVDGDSNSTGDLGGSRCQELDAGVSPTSQAVQKMFMTPADTMGSSATGKHNNYSRHRMNGAALCRTPVKEPPAIGSQSFLYEAETPPLEALSMGSPSPDSYPSEGITGDAVGSIGPAFEACRLGQQKGGVTDGVGGSAGAVSGRAKTTDVFACGPRAMAEFSDTWKRSRCFSFVLGGRAVHPVTVMESAAAGNETDGEKWEAGRRLRLMSRDCSYRRSWEGLASVLLPVAPYTVESAGESFVPIARHENNEDMDVVSGIAVSMDGKTSHYLPLPSLLPPRPAHWRSISSSITDEATRSSGRKGAKSSMERPTVGKAVRMTAAAVVDAMPDRDRCRNDVMNEDEKASNSCSWKDLPSIAVETISVHVGFPWLCAGWSSDLHHKKRRKRSSNGGSRKYKCWNQALFLCRRWNAFGVDALNHSTVNEPSGRWGLLMDVMETSKSTKVCVDMKSALVCLQGLGIRVRGTLEDPAVAAWLAEPPIDDAAIAALADPPHGSKKRKAKALPALPKASTTSLALNRQPSSFVDLWCMQAVATLSLMAEKEQVLQDLSLLLPFHLLEMPAVIAAASMEYCGLGVKTNRLLDMRREVDQRLRDLKGLADQLVQGVEDMEGEREKTILASSKRVHDMLYVSLRVKPPASWKEQIDASSSVGGSSYASSASRRGISKQAKLGPTDTASLKEILAASGPDGPKEDPGGFIRAVIQHRALVPASHSLGRLLRGRRWHVSLEGTRVNPRIELFTSTGRMVTSDPPLQNLEHKIRLTRSWRLSLAEEREADVQELQMVPRLWGTQYGGKGREAQSGHEALEKDALILSQESVDYDVREGLKVILASSSSSGNMSTGQLVAIVEDRCLNHPIFKLPSGDGDEDGVGVVQHPEAETSSLASFWRERGFPYTEEEASKTPQVLVRLGSSTRGPVYSYPADKVWRVRASFLADNKAVSMLSGDADNGNPWFGREALLKPRDAIVASPGYTFVSADYSQVEMRLMAHLSGDRDLMKVFSDGGDVFRRISAALQGRKKAPEDVTDEERRQAKVIVYGVLYGQSAAALAQQLGVRTGAAWKVRETVLTTYPQLRDYIQQVKDECKTSGYVETLLGRRRYLPEINSPDDRERARAERQAANTVCQGSAADLLKLAATNVAARLDRCKWMSAAGAIRAVSPSMKTTAAGEVGRRSPCRFPNDRGRSEFARCPPCRLVLSIHDELLYEVLEPHAAEVTEIVRACMEGAVNLFVPLVAHPRQGKMWGGMALATDKEDD